MSGQGVSKQGVTTFEWRPGSQYDVATTRGANSVLASNCRAQFGDKFGESLGRSQLLESPQTSSEVPQTSPEVFRRLPQRFSSLRNLTAIQGFPGSFPDFPGSSPGLRGPAAILTMLRDTCSDSISKLFRACFCGVSHKYRAIRCKMGYRTNVPV